MPFHLPRPSRRPGSPRHRLFRSPDARAAQPGSDGPRADLAGRDSPLPAVTAADLDAADVDPVWSQAQSLTGLCQTMIGWLRGSLESYPGYDGGPAPETVALLPALEQINDAGVLTFNSQPGKAYQPYQRATVHAFATPADASLLERTATGDGMWVWRWRTLDGARVSSPYLGPDPAADGRRVPVTWHNRVTQTWAGTPMPADEVEGLWRPHLSASAWNELSQTEQVCVVDPVVGSRDSLWHSIQRALDVPPPPQQ